MRVLLVSELFLPRPHGGGVSRHLHGLAGYLREQGDEVSILSSKLHSMATESVLPEGIRVLRKLNSFGHRFFLDDVKGIYNSLNLTKELDRIGNNFDIVHVHSTRIHLLYLATVSNPVIATVHGIFPVCIRESLLYDLCKSANWARCTACYINAHTAHAMIAPAVAINSYCYYKFMRKSLINMQKIICVSEYVKQQMKDCCSLLEDRMIAIPNGVKLEDFKNSKQLHVERFRKEMIGSNDRIILFVGRLLYEKGVHVLIASMPEILKTVNAKLVIVGAGPIKDFLERKVERAGLNGKVVFAGRVDDQTLRLFYKAADVSVVPSLHEPFGITAIEAFAARTPLVVADSGGLSEIVENDRTGVKVVPNDAKALAEGIMKILLDPLFAQRLRSNAYREVLDKYSWERVGFRIRRLYQSLAD